MKKKKICLLTLAKGNSNRLKNKNMKIFHGKPMLFWTIKKNLKISKNTYVNSDSDEILKFALKCGAKIIKRNPNLLGDEIPSRLLILDSFKYFPKNTHGVIHVQANSPNLKVEQIKKCFEIIKYTNVEDIFTLTSKYEINGSMWGITKKKLMKYNLSKKLHDHKSLKNECWFIDDSIDIHYKKDFERAKKIFSIK